MIIYNLIGGGDIKKWDKLKHNGVLFPDEYKQHYTPIIVNGKKIVLNKEAEEYATIYSKYMNTEYIKNKIFNINFWEDWKEIVDNKEIKKLEDCNFNLIYNYTQKKKEKENEKNKEEKKKEKEEKDIINEKYKYAYINDIKVKVSNYKVEPPGLFLGRGKHPKLGKIKKRIMSEDIILNIGENEVIPKLEKGRNWKSIIHDNTVEWIAAWKDNITGKIKYIWLADKSVNDKKKYDLVQKLKKKIGKIRKQIQIDLKDGNIEKRQLATSIYLIDLLALRVGNEKNEDQADTVGVSTLRKEHIKLLEDNKIKLKFLGKDSVEYKNEVLVEEEIYENLKEFIKDKKEDDQIFDKISPIEINEYLKSFMKNLTAKLFRTYNATNLFEIEINKIIKKYKDYDKKDRIQLLIKEYNKANLKVAITLNHQKNISKGFNDNIIKIEQKIKELEDKYNEVSDNKKDKIKEKIKKLKDNKKEKIQTKNLSLSTSKINYIDPRITFYFSNELDVPIEKLFTKTLIDKYMWASDISDYN